MTMVKDTIQAVRKAEQEAAKVEKDTAIARDEMICHAQNDVSNMLKKLQEQQTAQTAEALAKTEEECKQNLARIEEETAVEIEAMRKLADRKRDEAVDAVLAELI